MPAVTKPRKSNAEVVSPLAASAENQLIFGITLDLTGTLIPISAADVANWKKKGAKLALPGNIEVGSLAEGLKFLENWLEVKLPSPENLPEPFKKVVEAITNLVIIVYAAEIEI